MMPSWFQILIVIVLIVLLFGRGKISDLMGDVAKGIKSFKKGMSDDDETPEAREIREAQARAASNPVSPDLMSPASIEHRPADGADLRAPRTKTTRPV